MDAKEWMAAIKAKKEQESATNKMFEGIWEPGASVSEADYMKIRVAQNMVAEMSYQSLDRPDVTFMIHGMLPFPIFKVQRLEVARSQDLLQYRAIGGEFLAQQRGGNWGVRIDALLTGNTQMMELTILQYLKAWSRTRESSVDPEDQDWNKLRTETQTADAKIEAQTIVDTPKHITENQAYINALRTRDLDHRIIRQFESRKPGGGLLPYGRGMANNLVSICEFLKDQPYYKRKNLNILVNKEDMKYDLSKTAKTTTVKRDVKLKSEVDAVNPISQKTVTLQNKFDKNIKYVLPSDHSWPATQWHNTFTVVTRDEILPEMYIETLAYRITHKHGTKAIEVNILLRHFRPPDTIIDSEFVIVNKGIPISKKIKNRAMGINFGDQLYTLRKITTKPRIGAGGPLRKLKLLNLGIQFTHIFIQQKIRYGLSLFNRSPESMKYRKVNTISRLSESIYKSQIFTSIMDAKREMQIGMIL